MSHVNIYLFCNSFWSNVSKTGPLAAQCLGTLSLFAFIQIMPTLLCAVAITRPVQLNTVFLLTFAGVYLHKNLYAMRIIQCARLQDKCFVLRDLFVDKSGRVIIVIAFFGTALLFRRGIWRSGWAKALGWHAVRALCSNVQLLAINYCSIMMFVFGYLKAHRCIRKYI